MKKLTKELITQHKDIAGYLNIPGYISKVIDGRLCDVRNLPFLALIADLMREKFPERFHYLEVGTLFGGSLCAVGYKQMSSDIEKYAGIDMFTYYGEKIEPSSGVEVSIERADRNVRYFGVKGFALFEGDSKDKKVANRALALMRGSINMLYLDGDHTAAGVAKDFEIYSQFVIPGGVVVFDDYHNNDWPGVTEFVDGMDKTGWVDVGCLIPNNPTFYVLQKEEPHE